MAAADRLQRVGPAQALQRELPRPIRNPGSDPTQPLQISGPYQNAFELGGNFSWELDLWGRVRRAKEAATADVMASEDARRAMMLTVVTSVATSYVQLLALDHQLELAQQAQKNRSDALNLIQKKYEGGAASQLDVARAKAALATTSRRGSRPRAPGRRTRERDLAPARAQSRPGQARLAARAEAAADPGGRSVRHPRAPPDVMEAEQNLVSANAKIGVAKAEYFPTLSLTALLGLGATEQYNLFQRSAGTGSIGAGLLGPIFSGGRIRATSAKPNRCRSRCW